MKIVRSSSRLIPLSFWIVLLITCSTLVIAQSPDGKIDSAVIIHWNDFHSSNLPFEPTWGVPKGTFVGGYANVAGYIDSLRRVYPGALVLNGGDDFQGSPVSSLTKGMSQILILNRIKPSVMTIGNHEFDYGPLNLKKAISEAQFPFVSCNLYDSTKNGLLTEPYVIVQSGSLKIAVIGFVLKTMKHSTLPENVKGIGVLDPATEIMKYVRELNDRTDLIVVLSHNGDDYDSLIANNLSDVDVIIGAHSHTPIRKPAVVNNIVICQAGSNGRFVGLLNAKVDKARKSIVSYDYQLIETRLGGVTASPIIAHIVDSLESNIRVEMDRVIGDLKVSWKRNDRGESNIGSWICDVTREYFQTDIAMMNSGGIRKGLNAGPIKVRDLWEISPFDNSVEIISLTGEQLTELLKWRIENPRDFLQVSGLRYVYNNQQKHLISAEVNGKPIDPTKIYTIATNNFVVGQFERFFGLKPGAVDIRHTPIIGRDVMIDAVLKQPVIRYETDGRIIDQAGTY
ncbi:MAG: bifunctional UDP-sugar hydrolase/5'-nucleotidase [Candidatus Marinimicrobia bacterium]|nr:bifunctional UDP-sugar hydrolase/5'-nucleotidase [Candidatus Neomarinimicrobiota bacterium]